MSLLSSWVFVLKRYRLIEWEVWDKMDFWMSVLGRECLHIFQLECWLISTAVDLQQNRFTQKCLSEQISEMLLRAFHFKVGAQKFEYYSVPQH